MNIFSLIYTSSKRKSTYCQILISVAAHLDKLYICSNKIKQFPSISKFAMDHPFQIHIYLYTNISCIVHIYHTLLNQRQHQVAISFLCHRYSHCYNQFR